MGYTDPTTIHDPATGDAAPAAWGDAVNADLNFLHGNAELVIASTSLATSATSISSGTLPAVTNGWLLRARLRVQHTAGSGNTVGLRFNGDSGSNYVRQYVYGNDTTVAADAATATTQLELGSASNDSSARWQMVEAETWDYLGSGQKAVLARAWDQRNLTAPLLQMTGGNWASTSPITAVSFHAASGGFAVGTRLVVTALAYNP